MVFVEFCLVTILWVDCLRVLFSIDENRLDLSGIPDFLFPRFLSFFSGYGHHHISHSLNFIKNIFRIVFFCNVILIYVYGLGGMGNLEGFLNTRYT